MKIKIKINEKNVGTFDIDGRRSELEEIVRKLNEGIIYSVDVLEIKNNYDLEEETFKEFEYYCKDLETALGIYDRILELDSYDIEKLEAACEAGCYSDIDEYLNHLDDICYYKDMTLEEVAEQLVEECYNLPEFALRYFDYEAFARDLSFDGYAEVAGGVISC